MSSHEYKGHKIKVEARPGAARPWGVWVDGVELFGSGDRVRRRLAYGTAAAALEAGKRCVRALAAAGFDVHPPAVVWGQEGSTAQRFHDAVTDLLQPAPVQPTLYPCGCSRLKVNSGRCDQYKPGEVP